MWWHRSLQPQHKEKCTTWRNPGGILICALIAVRVVFSDTVKSEEDVERYLSIPVLAVIPKKREKGKKKEKHKSPKEPGKGETRKEEIRKEVKGPKEEEQING